MIGTTIAHYKVLRELGRGGMGIVYLADDPRLRRKVAIKALPPEAARDPVRRKRFELEARAAAALNHPGIAQVHQLEEQGEDLYIVFEYVEGCALRSMARQGGAPQEELFNLATGIARALAAAHAQGIVHRDLKPENVLVTASGETKILDFGLARMENNALDTTTVSIALTTAGTIVGTVGYMSPEQLQCKDLDFRSDIFSFGVMLYELACGTHPFQGSNPASTIANILNEQPPPLTSANPLTPPELERIVSKCLRKKREERYQSTSDLVVDLENFQRNSGEKPPVQSLQSRVIGFGVYEVDVRARELRKHGVKIKLQEKPFAALIALLERDGELVTREELSKKLWAADTFVDFDHSLGGAIHKLRLALNDTAKNPRFIETLAGRGFRLIVPVRKTAWEKSESRKRVLAVLPLENLEKDLEQEYFADGLTEEMISQLGRISPATLGVIARASAMRYKHTTKAVKQIGTELGVDFLVEGTVRRSGNRLRISVELIQVSDETQLWSSTYDRPVKNVFLIQAEVARQIAHALTLELVPQQGKQRLSDANLKAYELYLQGRYHWEKRTEEGFSTGFELFRRAVDADPSYELPYLGLADSYAVFGFYGTLPPKDAYEKAKSAALTALKINEQLPEAHSALAFATLEYDWDWAAAEREHRRAIEINPNCATAYHWYGLNLTQVGRFKEALTALEKASELDPLSVAVPTQIGWLMYFSRRYEQAITKLRGAIESDPQFALAHYFLGMTLTQHGMYPEAIRELQQAVQLTVEHPACVGALALAYALCGKRPEWQKNFDKLKSLSERRHVSPYYFAYALMASNESDKIIEWLEKAYDERSGWLIYSRIEPAFDKLRPDPRFVELMQRADPFGSKGKSQAAYSE